MDSPSESSVVSEVRQRPGCVETTEDSSAPGTPSVASASDLGSFEGARAGQAEMGIRNLRYEPVRSEGLTTWNFNRKTGACAEITTSDGRYSSVTMLPARDC
ncbi:hypothetical protein [Salipiger bermudensis]|uniref:Uncharacterized protein n=1 Tax=Salipiger bermudensis (strain DSM 26914 / JCM 13377 / KCTC 12554 / HTCC2601) TaxID=314265 RepID=Q0FTZ0_SALBH|nr:hypothetical protein [Salipiger bermudensis]EAU47609.1 hypothetical protein R2601_19769 [Salipiger bermudensis HTCC2601]